MFNSTQHLLKACAHIPESPDVHALHGQILDWSSDRAYTTPQKEWLKGVKGMEHKEIKVEEEEH